MRETPYQKMLKIIENLPFSHNIDTTLENFSKIIKKSVFFYIIIALRMFPAVA
jgi:hypothetical protein